VGLGPEATKQWALQVDDDVDGGDGLPSAFASALGGADTEGRALPTFELLHTAAAAVAPPAASYVADPLLSPSVRTPLLRCLVSLELIICESPDIVDSFRWPAQLGSPEAPAPTSARAHLRLLLGVARDAKCRTVLHSAVALGSAALVAALLAEESSLQLLPVRDRDGRTALHAAVHGAGSSAEVVRLLLQHDAVDPNALDSARTSALHLAAADAPLACVEALLAAGALRIAAVRKTPSWSRSWANFSLL
jgi:hypothetical protein